MLGLFRKNKGKPDKLFLNSNPVFNELLTAIIKEVSETNQYIHANSQLKFVDSEAYQRLKNFKPSKKKDFLLYLQQQVIASYQLTYPRKDSVRHKENYYQQYAICQNLFALLMRSKLDFTEDEFLNMVKTYIAVQNDKSVKMSFIDWPIGFTANQLVKFIKTNSPSESFIDKMREVLETEQFQATRLYSGMDIGKSREKMRQVLDSQAGESKVTPYKADEEDNFGVYINQLLTDVPENEKDNWYSLLHHCATAKGGKPSKVWLKKADEHIDKITPGKYKPAVHKLLEFARNMPFKEGVYMASHAYLGYQNSDVLKGLVWSLVRFHDHKTLKEIALLTEKCFHRLPNIGPAAAGPGNACIYVLAQSRGMEGVSHLSRLKLRIQQNNTQKLIDKYIQEQAIKQGLLPSQIEEIAVQDFGLTKGKRSEEFNDYTLGLEITSVGKAELKWIKPDGKQQKTVPAFVKGNSQFSEKLKKMRALAREIKQASTAQRDRIDRLYTENRVWTYEEFDKFYINHGLVSTIARKLIWLFENDKEQIAAFLNDDQWQDVAGKTLKLDENSKIRLWHPIDSSPDEVLAWRDRLDEWQIQQPMKQAYREVYLLTDAEINTRIYSNRMASHLLKQHQFNALTAIRGWKYSLLGAYDDGRDGETAQKALPAYNMVAQFWIYELHDTDAWNDAGIWDYVATDQIRFVDADEEPIELIDVDKLVLSEIMRDADLFVGVASVGNDPQWQDNEGGAQHHDYWQSFSFGDLSEVAKTRKQVLERLVPRLKIKDIAHIDGKFLVIKGKRHRYKIHIGSTNILIIPNDKYLCIVPSRGKDKNLQNVFLPFEGDRGLSIILSKAFMLAADDKITDKTILSQL